MARAAIILLLLSILYVAGVTKADTTTGSNATDFIKNSCKTTLYPEVCVETLSGYASKIKQSQYKLAKTALFVSRTKANSTKVYVSELSQYKGLDKRVYYAIKDCLDQMSDSVERLHDSFKELKNMGSAKGKDFSLHMNNVQTWASAALTDEDTCLDGFDDKALDGKMKDNITARVTNVAQITSNALAFVNQYGSGK